MSYQSYKETKNKHIQTLVVYYKCVNKLKCTQELKSKYHYINVTNYEQIFLTY